MHPAVHAVGRRARGATVGVDGLAVGIAAVGGGGWAEGRHGLGFRGSGKARGRKRGWCAGTCTHTVSPTTMLVVPAHVVTVVPGSTDTTHCQERLH